MKEFIIILVMSAASIIGAMNYASHRLCLPTEKMAWKLGMAKYAFTATFIAGQLDRGIVMQLYTGRNGFIVSWAKNYGRTSCVLVKGDNWYWADHVLNT